ncbi:signal peptidase I [Enterococcus sp. LJL120]
MEKAKGSKKHTPPKERTAQKRPPTANKDTEQRRQQPARTLQKTSQKADSKAATNERAKEKQRQLKNQRSEVSQRETTDRKAARPQSTSSSAGKKRPRKPVQAPSKNSAAGKKVATKKKRPQGKAKRLTQTKGYQAIRYLQYGAEILFTLAVVVFCIWFTVNIRAHFVNGESMSPTFATGDRLFTNKNSEVERYDIITFFPGESSETYLKRVVALPGDSIYVMGNNLYIFAGEVDAENIPGIIYSAQLPDSTQIVTIDDVVAEEMAGLKEVPADQFFVMGDNRGNSRDSRALGLIDREQIEGVVSFRFYPFDKFGFVH